MAFFFHPAVWDPVSALALENPACDANGTGMKWVYPEEKPIRSAAVVVHGFNLKSDKMNEIVGLLSSNGSIVVNVTLSGHDGDYDAMRTVTRGDWLRDLHQASCAARRKADEYGVPLYYVGMSLGALMHLDMLRETDAVRFDKRVLLSPAISIRWYAHLIRGANILYYNIDLMSQSHEDYRVYDELPISAYNALFEAYENVQEAKEYDGWNTGWNIPTIVFADEKDILIDLDGLHAFIEEKGLTRWEIVAMDNEKSLLAPNYHHLQVDSPSMGSDVWSLFSERVVHFFYSPADGRRQEGKLKKEN